MYCVCAPAEADTSRFALDQASNHVCGPPSANGSSSVAYSLLVPGAGGHVDRHGRHVLLLCMCGITCCGTSCLKRHGCELFAALFIKF